MTNYTFFKYLTEEDRESLYSDVYYALYNMDDDDFVTINNSYCEDNAYYGDMVYENSPYYINEVCCDMTPWEIIENLTDDYNTCDMYVKVDDCNNIESDDEPRNLGIDTDSLTEYLIELEADFEIYELKDVFEEWENTINERFEEEEEDY